MSLSFEPSANHLFLQNANKPIYPQIYVWHLYPSAMELTTQITLPQNQLSTEDATQLLSEVGLPCWTTTKEIGPVHGYSYGCIRWLHSHQPKAGCGAYIESPLREQESSIRSEKLEGFFILPRDYPVSIKVTKVSVHLDVVFWEKTFLCQPSERVCFIKVDDDYRHFTFLKVQTETPSVVLPACLTISCDLVDLLMNEFISNEDIRSTSDLAYNSGCIEV